jgi:DNA-binding transcriptional LysR family regulator
MDQLDAMRNFVRIVEAGSISRAADQLGLAKSGVSRRLVELEQQLGVRLLNRTTRRSSLTDAGQAYYEGALRLLGDVAELDASVAERETALKGTLKLAAPLSFGLCHLAPAIDEFIRIHPDVTIDVDFSDRQVDLVEQGLDLALRIAELDDSSLQARRICTIRLLLCASPGYLADNGTPRKLEELSNHRLLHYDLGGRPQWRLRDEQGRERTVESQPFMKANNGDFLRDMAIAGHGIILSPTFISWQALAAGELVPVLPGCEPQPLNAWAVYPRSRFLSQRTRAFIDFLAGRFGGTPYWDDFPGSVL